MEEKSPLKVMFIVMNTITVLICLALSVFAVNFILDDLERRDEWLDGLMLALGAGVLLAVGAALLLLTISFFVKNQNAKKLLSIFAFGFSLFPPMLAILLGIL